MTFLEPGLLLAALLVPLALSWRLRRGRSSVPLGHASLADDGRIGDVPALPRTWRTSLASVPVWLWAAGMLLLVVALARPVVRTPLPRTTEGIDILLCLDVSSSMTAGDMDRGRSRLAVAQEAAREFVEVRTDDRIGLVTFARFPDVICPPTLDHDALADFLAAVETVASDGPEDATGIGTAVARSAQVLASSEAGSRVVILLTDGEENVARADTPGEISPLHAAQLCEQLGVRIYSIVAGADPDGAGEPDVGQVERLAERTGGGFFRARDVTALRAVYASIGALERVEFEEPRFRIEERFAAFLLAAIALLLASRALEATVFEVLP